MLSTLPSSCTTARKLSKHTLPPHPLLTVFPPTPGFATTVSPRSSKTRVLLVSLLQSPSSRDLFVAPRNVTVRFPRRSDQLINLLCRVRLKRKIAAPATAQLSSGQRRIDGRDRFMADASVGYFGHLSGMSCLYSSFIVCLCRFISSSIESISVASHRPSLISTKHLIDEYDQDPLSSSRARGNSILFNSSFFNSSSSNAKATFPPGKIIASAHLAFKVVLEALNCLLRCNYTPDEVVYR